MFPDIQWIVPMYRFGRDIDRISVRSNARNSLLEMANRLVGTPGLVAIYTPRTVVIPQNAEEGWAPRRVPGCVVGAVRPLSMPTGQWVENYPCPDLDGSDRWPIGWPCEVVYELPATECPALRDHVARLSPPISFQEYVLRFNQRGLFELEPVIQMSLNEVFARCEAIS
jgi:hypothetical protein